MNDLLNIGDTIQTLASEAKRKFVIIAPFIKTIALERIIESLPPDIPLVCVTRWLAEEIAAGVCDLAILDTLKSRGNSTLYLQPNLHAKLYRNETSCLIGSANLTLKALGWHSSSNLEFSYTVASSEPSVVNFERLLFLTAMLATDQIRQEIEERASAYAEENSMRPNEEIPADIVVPSEWLPTCNRPDRLFSIYKGTHSSTVLNSIIQSGKDDLSVTGLDTGLSEDGFRLGIRSFLVIHPVVLNIINNEKSTFSEKDGHDIIHAILGDTPLKYSMKDHWTLLKRWLLYFFPEIFREPPSTSLLQKGSELGSYQW